MPIGVEEYEVAKHLERAADDHAGRPQAVPGQSPGKGTQTDGPGQRLYLLRGGSRPDSMKHLSPTAFAASSWAARKPPNRMVLAVAEMPGVSIDLATVFLPEPARSRTCCSTTTAVSTKNGRPSSAAIMARPSASPSPSSRRRRRRLPWLWRWIFPSRSTLTARSSSANTSRTSRTPNRGRWTWPSSPWKTIRSGGTGPWRFKSEFLIRFSPAPSYKGDRAGALRLTRLILNELHFPLSNAIVWVEDEKGANAPGSWNVSTTPTLIPRTWIGIRWCC